MGTAPPAPGADLVITLGSINSGTRLFAGKMLSEEQGYLAQKPANVYHRLNGIDYTWLLGEHLVIRQYTNQTVAVIATDLIASFAEGMTAHHIAADAGAILIDAISFTNVALADALSQLCSRAGAYWYLDYFRDLHLFETEPTTIYPDPTPLTPAHPSSQQADRQQDSVADRDARPGRRRRRYRARRSAAGRNDHPDGYDRLVSAARRPSRRWRAADQLQRICRRRRRSAALVGPGVTPTTPVSLTPASGAGVTIGAHDYAVSYVTAAGESLVGPRATVNVTGLMAPPAAAPIPTQQAGGNGPDAGAHYYATTFVTATGETAPSPAQWYMQNSIAAPTVPITIVDANDGSGYTVPGLKVGDSILLFSTYTADATDRVAPFPAAGETSWGPASAAYVVKQQPGRTGFMNFQASVRHSADPNVKFIHIWMSVNGAPSFYVAVPVSGKANIANQPAGTFYNFLYSQTLFYTSQIIPSVFNPILGSVLVSGIATGPAGVTARKVYRTTTYTAAPLLLLATIADNTTTTYLDAKTDASLGAVAPATGTAAAAQVAVSSIPIGPATVTARRIYRTAAGASPLKLLSALGDNTTTTYTDAAADASLGANAPASDTSGIPQAAGTVFAGSPTMILAGIPAAFSPTGGWAIVGNGQVIVRYKGISGNNLTGIPPFGVGSITTSISYGSLCTASPALTGVPTSGAGAILYGLKSGDGLQLLVTVDDVAAQTALAGMIGGSGIKEAYIQDRRIGYAEAVARGQAMIDERADLLVEVHYVCRDVRTKSGRTIHAAMPAPTNLAGDYKIQDVTIANFSAVPGHPPTYTVQASSQRYSLDDLLRIARGTIGA